MTDFTMKWDDGGDTYIVPETHKARARYILLSPKCAHTSHKWRPVPGLDKKQTETPAGHIFKHRGCDKCARCGVLKWSW